MCLKVTLMNIVLKELTCKNHEEVHRHDSIRTEIQKFLMQLKKVKISKLTGRNKILHLHLALGLISDLMGDYFKVIFMSLVSRQRWKLEPFLA